MVVVVAVGSGGGKTDKDGGGSRAFVVAQGSVPTFDPAGGMGGRGKPAQGEYARHVPPSLPFFPFSALLSPKGNLFLLPLLLGKNVGLFSLIPESGCAAGLRMRTKTLWF